MQLKPNSIRVNALPDNETILGMLIGHYFAWIVAGLMYAVQLQETGETSVAPDHCHCRMVNGKSRIIFIRSGSPTHVPSNPCLVVHHYCRHTGHSGGLFPSLDQQDYGGEWVYTRKSISSLFMYTFSSFCATHGTLKLNSFYHLLAFFYAQWASWCLPITSFSLD